MTVLNMDDLEEALTEILPTGFQIETDNHGQIIVYTGLHLNDDGELEDYEPSDDEDAPEVDEDFEPLEEDDDED
jgi:hypothetical protein